MSGTDILGWLCGLFEANQAINAADPAINDDERRRRDRDRNPLWPGCLGDLNNGRSPKIVKINKPLPPEHIALIISDLQRHMKMPYNDTNFPDHYYPNIGEQQGRVYWNLIGGILANNNQIDLIYTIFTTPDLLQAIGHSVQVPSFHIDIQGDATPVSIYSAIKVMIKFINDKLSETEGIQTNVPGYIFNVPGYIFAGLIELAFHVKRAIKIGKDINKTKEYQDLVIKQRDNVQNKYPDIAEKFSQLWPTLDPDNCPYRPTQKSARCIA